MLDQLRLRPLSGGNLKGVEIRKADAAIGIESISAFLFAERNLEYIRRLFSEYHFLVLKNDRIPNLFYLQRGAEEKYISTSENVRAGEHPIKQYTQAWHGHHNYGILLLHQPENTPYIHNADMTGIIQKSDALKRFQQGLELLLQIETKKKPSSFGIDPHSIFGGEFEEHGLDAYEVLGEYFNERIGDDHKPSDTEREILVYAARQTQSKLQQFGSLSISEQELITGFFISTILRYDCESADTFRAHAMSVKGAYGHRYSPGDTLILDCESDLYHARVPQARGARSIKLLRINLPKPLVFEH